MAPASAHLGRGTALAPREGLKNRTKGSRSFLRVVLFFLPDTIDKI